MNYSVFEFKAEDYDGAAENVNWLAAYSLPNSLKFGN